jgi:hypothetical protein
VELVLAREVVALVVEFVILGSIVLGVFNLELIDMKVCIGH